MNANNIVVVGRFEEFIPLKRLLVLRIPEEDTSVPFYIPESILLTNLSLLKYNDLVAVKGMFTRSKGRYARLTASKISFLQQGGDKIEKVI